MNINELFEALQNNFLPEELKGEFILQGNCIIWSYNLQNDSEEIDAPNEEEDELNYNFEASSSEELLLEAYQEDMEQLQVYLDNIGEENWTFGDPDIDNTTISFKIF